jgi:hypothetical protein
MNEYDAMVAAAEIIKERRPDLKAEVEHTGGNIWCIGVTTEDLKEDDRWYFGTADEKWGGSCYNGEREIKTELPSDCLDPDEISSAILGALRYVCPHCGSPVGFEEQNHAIVKYDFTGFDADGEPVGHEPLKLDNVDIDSVERCENDTYRCRECRGYFDHPMDKEE